MSEYKFNDFCYPQPPTTLRDMWPGYFSDQVCVNGDYLVAPPNLLCRIDGPERPSFEPRRLRKEGATFWVTERSGREIRVGDLTLTEKHLVDFKEDGTFAALLCSVSAGESYQARTIAIPYKDLIRRRITPYLADLPRNIDCPISYLIEAFYTELRGGDPCKFLHLPQRSGWQENAGSLHFTSAADVIPVLRDLYPPDILRRRLLHTNLSMKDAALRLKELLPNDCWQTKLILTASAASLTLPYFEKYGLRNNRILILRADSVHGSNQSAALLRTENYEDTKICALSECRTVLQRVLDLTQDGTALFRDTSLVEDRRKRDAALNVLVQDLQRGQGISDTRHLIAVIADNPGSYPSEIPAIHLTMPTLKDCDLRQLQHAVGELHAALIHELEGSVKTGNLFIFAMNQAKKQGLLPLRTSTAEPAGGTLCILSIAAAWLHCCGLISEKELREIRRFLAGGYRRESAGDQLVINDFRRRLSGMICKDALRVFPQSGPPYYAVNSTCAFTDGRWLNLETSAFDRVIGQLTTTQSRRAVLHALANTGILHCNNNFKRLVDVETAPLHRVSLYAYSIPVTFLSEAAQRKIRLLDYADHLLMETDYPIGFIPILRIGDRHAAGRLIDDSIDEADSMYTSGQTRSGKSYFLAQHAMLRALCGQRVIVFDQTGAFSDEELAKHLPTEIISEYVSRWNIYQRGLPIDPLTLENCTTLPEKKDHLFSILSTAAKLTGDVKAKVLKKHLSHLVKAITAGTVKTLPDIPRFFDPDGTLDRTDPEFAEIIDRLRDVCENLAELPVHHRTWETFLREQKPIVIISTEADGLRKDHQLADMLLADLYRCKQYHRDQRITVVLDEIEDLSLDRDGPISTMLRKGGKHRLSLLLASQQYSVEQDRLGKLIGNCDTHIIFHPKDADIRAIAQHLGCDPQMLASLEQGECIVVGSFYSCSRQKNQHALLSGKAFPAKDFIGREG